MESLAVFLTLLSRSQTPVDDEDTSSTATVSRLTAGGRRLTDRAGPLCRLGWTRWLYQELVTPAGYANPLRRVLRARYGL